jgi:hypothetical protein
MGLVKDKHSRHSVRADFHPALGDGIGPRWPEACANLLYTKLSHAAIKTHAIAAIAIVNRKSRPPPIPRAAFDDLLSRPLGRRMPRYLDMQDLSISKPDHEEHIKRLE